MEPGDLRESPAGSGESDAGDWREVVPGEDKEVKAAETNGTTLETTRRDTCEESGSDKGVGEQLHSPYEEELDPRIQVQLLLLLFHHSIEWQRRISQPGCSRC